MVEALPRGGRLSERRSSIITISLEPRSGFKGETWRKRTLLLHIFRSHKRAHCFLRSLRSPDSAKIDATASASMDRRPPPVPALFTGLSFDTTMGKQAPERGPRSGRGGGRPASLPLNPEVEAGVGPLHASMETGPTSN